MTLFYLSTTDIHELRSPSTLGPAYGVAFETYEAAAMAAGEVKSRCVLCHSNRIEL